MPSGKDNMLAREEEGPGENRQCTGSDRCSRRMQQRGGGQGASAWRSTALKKDGHCSSKEGHDDEVPGSKGGTIAQWGKVAPTWLMVWCLEIWTMQACTGTSVCLFFLWLLCGLDPWIRAWSAISCGHLGTPTKVNCDEWLFSPQFHEFKTIWSANGSFCSNCTMETLSWVCSCTNSHAVSPPKVVGHVVSTDCVFGNCAHCQ